MEKKQIETLLQRAKSLFLQNDTDLLIANVNERSLTHKFAEYLQLILSKLPNNEWKVDCEYNRYGHHIKALDRVLTVIGVDMVPVTSVKSISVYPDIIIHRRGSGGPNLLIIEAKKDPTLKDRLVDIQKIKAIKDGYGYTYGVFLIFNTEEQVISWEYED